MEKTRLEIISREIIKPSSPTPPPHAYHELSLIDQMAPPILTPSIYFYESQNQQDQTIKMNKIKTSLAQTLTRFNLLAGTMSARFYIHCNDVGIEFFEAKLDCKLSILLENPKVNLLNQLLPLFSNYLLAVQFINFSCGSVAIAVCLSHKLADGLSAATFVKSWAAATRGDEEYVKDPSFDAVKIFPPRKIPSFKRGIEPSKEKILTKRIVFDKSNIAALKELAMADGGVKPPSRVVAVSSFIWLRLMALAKEKPVKPKFFGALYPVDLRMRMDPPLPENSFGNVSWFTVAKSPVEMEEDLPVLVAKVRTAIQEIDSDFVKKLGDAETLLDLIKEFDKQKSTGDLQICSFTSWCRFPVYEADFGWGKPCWVCSPSRPFRNSVVLMGTSDGDGIEAWVNLKEEDMAIFENDVKLLSFCSA